MSLRSRIAGLFGSGTSQGAAGAPFIAARMGLGGLAGLWVLALLPAAAAAFRFHGAPFLATLAISCAASVAVEVAFALARRRSLVPGALLPGMALALVLPPGTPLWMAGLGAAFGTFFGKEVFGGTGHNLFNPAVVGKCFLFLSYPTVMMEAVRNSAAGAVAGASLFGPQGGGAGEVCAACILAGALLLVLTRAGSWRVMLAVELSAGALATALWAFAPERFDAPLGAILSGGILFGAAFLATDLATSPTSKGAKWVYGVMVGVLAIVIRNFSAYNAYSQGMMFAVLLGNLFAPMLDSAALAIRSRGARA